MSLRNFLIGVLFICLSLALAFCNQTRPPHYHSFLAKDTFHKLSRKEQLLQCKSCHPTQFENERIGPHAQAYDYLKEHVAFVNSDSYDCDFYTDHVNEAYWMCKSCHAPQNLHETFLFDSMQNTSATLAKLMALRNPRPLARKDSELITGIDCMACHVKGNEMVSLKPSLTKEDSLVEKQTREVIVRNNLVCFSCHAEVVRSIDPAIAIRKTGVVRCVKCHQEYDAKGKGTHYYFWQHEAEGKTNPKVEKILTDFTYSYLPENNVVKVTWTNTNIPHLISSGPEMIWIYKLTDLKGALIAQDTLRVNKKKEFDEVMYRNMNQNYHRGVHGIDVPLDGKPLTVSISVKPGTKPSAIEVTVMHKSQYWFPDSLGSVLTTKKYPL